MNFKKYYKLLGDGVIVNFDTGGVSYQPGITPEDMNESEPFVIKNKGREVKIIAFPWKADQQERRVEGGTMVAGQHAMKHFKNVTKNRDIQGNPLDAETRALKRPETKQMIQDAAIIINQKLEDIDTVRDLGAQARGGLVQQKFKSNEYSSLLRNIRVVYTASSGAKFAKWLKTSFIMSRLPQNTSLSRIKRSVKAQSSEALRKVRPQDIIDLLTPYTDPNHPFHDPDALSSGFNRDQVSNEAITRTYGIENPTEQPQRDYNERIVFAFRQFMHYGPDGLNPQEGKEPFSIKRFYQNLRDAENGLMGPGYGAITDADRAAFSNPDFAERNFTKSKTRNWMKIYDEDEIQNLKDSFWQANIHLNLSTIMEKINKGEQIDNSTIAQTPYFKSDRNRNITKFLCGIDVLFIDDDIYRGDSLQQLKQQITQINDALHEDLQRIADATIWNYPAASSNSKYMIRTHAAFAAGWKPIEVTKPK